MAHAQIVVLEKRGKWLIRSGSQETVFPDNLTALKNAVDMANRSGKDGTPASVILLSNAGQPTTIWTYGQHPYPPKLSALTAA
jgi:hypothetical protein